MSIFKFPNYVVSLHVAAPKFFRGGFSSQMVTQLILAPFPRCDLMEQVAHVFWFCEEYHLHLLERWRFG